MKSVKIIFSACIFSVFLFSSCKDNELRMCFETDNNTPKVNERVNFNATCSKGLDLYHWNFGDGRDTITKVPNVQHTFDNAGYYTVTLHNTVTQVVGECSPNGNGNVASSTVEVTE